MLYVVLILAFLIGLLTVFFQLVQLTSRPDHQRLATVITSSNHLAYKRIPRDPEEFYVEGIGYIVGDVSCRYNACSPYIRCAVNPSGLCEGCGQYQPKNHLN